MALALIPLHTASGWRRFQKSPQSHDTPHCVEERNPHFDPALRAFEASPLFRKERGKGWGTGCLPSRADPLVGLVAVFFGGCANQGSEGKEDDDQGNDKEGGSDVQ